MITHDVINPQNINVVPMAKPAGKKFGRGSLSGGSGCQPSPEIVFVSSVMERSQPTRLPLQTFDEQAFVCRLS